MWKDILRYLGIEITTSVGNTAIHKYICLYYAITTSIWKIGKKWDTKYVVKLKLIVASL